jgi:hypothetical protein
MRMAIRVIGCTTLWALLAAVAGAQIGYHKGYTRGVRDIAHLIIELKETGGEIPQSPSKMDSRWGTP